MSRQFIFHLKPCGELAEFLDTYRQKTLEQFGIDTSFAYRPHVSMSGYFSCSVAEARQLGWRMRRIIKERIESIPKPNAYMSSAQIPLRIHSSPDLTRVSPASPVFPVFSPVMEGQSLHTGIVSQSSRIVSEMDSFLTLKGVVTTQDGYVLLDVESLFIRDAMAEIAKSAQAEGIEMRSKPINHVTLARDRHDDVEKEAIAAMWDKALRTAPVSASDQSWRVVVYELVERTPLDELTTKGPHQLNEIISIPLIKDPPEKSANKPQDRGVSAPRIWVC